MLAGKTKILFLIHTLQVGGAERVLIDTVNRLDKTKFDVTVMTVVNVGALRKELDAAVHYKTIFDFRFLKKLGGGESKYATSVNTSKRKNPLKLAFIKSYVNFWRHANLFKLHQKYIGNDYDVEISFLEGIPAKIIAHSKNPHSRKLCWIHVDLKNEPKSDRFFKNLGEQKATYAKFDDIICVSEVVRDRFLEKIDVKPEHVKVIYNLIDKTSILAQAEQANHTKNSTFTFCSVGRLSRQKGYDRLINVVKRLEDLGYQFKVNIIGTGIEEASLKRQIEVMNVKSIALLGYHKNPHSYVKQADVFVCSSRAEGFSTAVAEAIILGKAIISTNCSGAEEMLGKKSEYGMICDNSEEGLFNAMRRVLDQKQLISDYEAKVKVRANMFDVSSTLLKIEAEIQNAN
jgi:hypothetical protein